MRRPTCKAVILNLLLITVGMAACFLIVEMGVRVFVPQRLVIEPRYLYEVSPTLGHRLSRNYEGVWQTSEYSTPIRTNSLGLRNNKIRKKTDNVFRILALGDSFTFSAGARLEDTYVKNLERLLGESSTIDFEVINAGVDGYGPEHYLKYLEEEGFDLKPDLITVGFYVANDVHDRIKNTWFIKDGILNSRTNKFSFKYSILSPINNFLEQRSHAFILMRTRLDYLLWKLGMRPYYFPQVFQKEYQASMIDSWEFTKRTLKSIARLSKQHRAKVAIVIIPTRYQVHQDIWREFLDIYEINEDAVDLSKPQEILTQFGEENDIHVVDLLPGFRKVGRTKRLYYKIDGHWNEEGHKWAAAEIYRFLASERLVPLGDEPLPRVGASPS